MSCHDISHLTATAREEGVGKPVKGFAAMEGAVAVTDAMAIQTILAISIPLAHSLFLACNTAIVLSGH